MGKVEDLMRGGGILESASHRGTPSAMPTVPMNRANGPDRMGGVSRNKAALEIPVGKIVADPLQPRSEDFDENALDRLAESIRTKGQLQPISVRWDAAAGTYVIIAGERRWTAARRAGVETMTCILMDREMAPGEILALQCIENLLREDLRPTEQARAYRQLMDLNGWSGNQLAKELGISQPAVVAALKLTTLPDSIRAMVDAEELPASAAATIASLDDPADQVEVAIRAVAGKMTRDDVAVEVRRRVANPGPSKGRGAKPAKVTERTIRTATGPRVVVEFKRGLTPTILATALREALATVEGESDQG